MKQEKFLGSLTLPRAYILPLLVGVVIVILGLVAMRPQINNIIKIRKEVISRQDRLTELKEKLSLLQGTSQSEVQRRVETIESVFPSEKPAVQIINTVSQLALDNELTFSGLNLNPGELTSDSSKTAKKKTSSRSKLGASFLEADFTVAGDRENVFAFLTALERAAPIMKIDALSLSVQEHQAGEVQQSWLEAMVEVSIFYKLPPNELGKVDTPLPLLSPEEIEAIAALDGFQLFDEFQDIPEFTGRDNPFSL